MLRGQRSEEEQRRWRKSSKLNMGRTKIASQTSNKSVLRRECIKLSKVSVGQERLELEINYCILHWNHGWLSQEHIWWGDADKLIRLDLREWRGRMKRWTRVLLERGAEK